MSTWLKRCLSLWLVSQLCWMPGISLAQQVKRLTGDAVGSQYGYGIKASINYSGREKITWRIGLSAGAGTTLARDWLYPALNADLMLYHGELGSNRPGVRRTLNYIDIETVLSYTLTVGHKYRFLQNAHDNPEHRSIPLYYFHNFTQPALQNPYRWSVTGGGNYVFFATRRMYKTQMVGFVNLHFNQVQVSYINDGPPFLAPLADRRDRFHTGSLLFSYHGDNHDAVNLVELSYQKFTGYTPSAYELSNMMGHSFVFYKDTQENFYNKSMWELTVANTHKNWGARVFTMNDPHKDLQHLIHHRGYYSLHLSPYRRSGGAGPIYYYQQSNINLR